MTDTPPTNRRPRWLNRPTLGHTMLTVLVASYIMAVLNTGFWRRLLEIFPDASLPPLLLGIAVWGLTVLSIELMGPGALQKPVAAVLIVLAASAAYFERAFGVLIDREMVRNVMETTTSEARHLVTVSAVTQIALTGLLPAALVFWPRVRRVRRWHHLWRWPVGVAVSVALVLGALAADYKAMSATLREQRELMSAYHPGATLAALVRYGKEQWVGEPPQARPIATDAAPGGLLDAADRPVLLVMFVGETLRAANFGLDGYSRDTTPGLRERNVVNLSNLSSCGTSTAVSVPCMFSPLTQDSYSRARFLAQENLLDILARVGFDVQWHDNNTGDQRVATRIGWQRVDATLAPEACEIECTDDVFLPLIESTLATIERNTVLVLHMIGNHGPAYYLRYRPEDAVFEPDCRTAQFADCSVDEIVNAYDNATLQTDRVLSRTIDLLAASDRVLPAVMFVSDHGESLGENGLYLHAAPMFMAPEGQTHVPGILWLGAAFAGAMHLDTGCLGTVAAEPTSHDMVFHTVLGLLDIDTNLHEAALDLTASCRRTEAS
ncbi:MAG: sulfatase-like hydrolase/transferase [Rhodobacteraceae bacterium]|nr:sulfatase-like hydrolase/transferase [Paracoccaceae bacterium]